MEKPFILRSSFRRASLGKDGAYRNLDTQGYTHRTVNYSIRVHCSTHWRPHQHNREHFGSFWGLPKPLQSEGGLHLPPSPLYVRGDVQGSGSAPVHKIPAPSRHNGLQRMSPSPPPGIEQNHAPCAVLLLSTQLLLQLPWISYRHRYIRMRTAAASHPWPLYFRCVFRDNNTPRIYLGHGWLSASAAIFGTRLQ